MKLADINATSIKKVTDKELLNLHYRTHQLYSQAKKSNNKGLMFLLEDKHDILAKEMDRRGIKHKSPLTMSLSKVKSMYTINEYLNYIQESFSIRDIKRVAHDCFIINSMGKIIATDPFGNIEISGCDLLIISHGHEDHANSEMINKLVSHNTSILTTKDVIRDKISGLTPNEVVIARPNQKYNIQGFKIETIPAYNTNKFRSPGVVFHPKSDMFGYIITIDGMRIYFAGDTDIIPEMKKVKCDIALLPVSGKYVMTPEEAAEAVRIIKPKIAIPMHYGSIYNGNQLGTKEDALKFKSLASKHCKVILL